ncbi:SPW repeat protein [Haloprofundus salinisoli]|uniref:SPW repeat protein n=1 Tax=Haloprofundus salinisoli TaxID=2876193 RepID=UPI001CC9DC60|nr:SPW repeat protein [Haloprofundus salinisoli]
MSTNTTDERSRSQSANPDESGKGLSAVIALLGLWMIIQAIMFDITATQFGNDVIIGGLLFAVGAYNYSRRSNERVGSIAAASVAALLGLWLIAAPFMFGADAGFTEATNDLAFWNDVIVGLLAFALGAYSAYEAREERKEAENRRTAT